MDIINDQVGAEHPGSSRLQACKAMMFKAAIAGHFIGHQKDPFSWAAENNFLYFNDVYRFWSEASGDGPVRYPIYPSGTKCADFITG